MKKFISIMLSLIIVTSVFTIAPFSASAAWQDKVTSVIAIGNGEETYLNDSYWNYSNEDNALTEKENGVWEMTMTDIYAFDNYLIKFAVNSVDDQGNPAQYIFGSEYERLYPANTEINAVWNGNKCIFEVEEDESTVKLQLDLRNFDFDTKTGAKMKITVLAPGEIESTVESETETILPTTESATGGETEPTEEPETEPYNETTIEPTSITTEPVTELTELNDIYSVIAYGNGNESYLRGVSWDPCNTYNALTEVEDGIWEMSMTDIYAFDNYQVKFAINSVDANGYPVSDPEEYTLGAELEQKYPINTEIDALWNGQKCIFEIEDDSNVLFHLDLRNFDMSTKTGAKFYISTYSGYSPTEYTFTTGNSTLKYVINGRGNAKITSYTGADTNLDIPEKINGYTVTEIEESAFYNQNALASVSIPESMEIIGDYAFKNCGSLSSITIPKNVWYAYRAFEGCSNLITVTFGRGIQSIPADILSGVYSLKNVIIPDTVKKIRGNAFWECRALSDIIIPDSVINIEEYAFSGCIGLRSLTLPKNIETLGSHSFRDCSFTYVFIPKTLRSISNSSSYSAFVPYGPFGDKLETAVLENGMERIPSELFRECSSLRNVTIPDSVNCIGKGAFRFCSSLTEISIPDSVITIDESAFDSCKLTSISLPKNLETLRDYAFSGCKFTEVIIPKTLNNISSGSYLSAGPFGDNLKTAILEEGSKNIPGYLFMNCTNLQNVIIPDSVTSIGGYAFRQCYSLKSITIPDSVTSIGQAAFSFCTSLTSITIPKSVISSGYYPFTGCSSLKTVVFENGMVNIPAWILDSAPSVENVVIPESVKSINGYAFNNCSDSLTAYCPKISYASIYFIDNDLNCISTNDSRLTEPTALNASESRFNILSGAKLKVTCDYAIKDDVFENGDNFSVKIHIPQGASVEDGSLYLNKQLITEYTERNEYIQIPVGNQKGKITFDLETSGDCKLRTYAVLNYSLNDQKGFDIIDVINEDIDLISLDAEEVTSSSMVKVSGLAPAGKAVAVSIDGEHAASFTANKAGVYGGNISIADPKNETEYTVQAVSSDSNGNQITAEKTVLYRENAPALTGFTMTYRGKTYDLTSGQRSSIVFVPGSIFRFDAKYINTDRVGDVYFTSMRNQVTKRIKATYDPATDTYTATGYFDENNHSYVPGKINVEYTPKLEEGFLSEGMDFDYNDLPEQYKSADVTVSENTENLYKASIRVSDSESYIYTQKNYGSVEELARELFPEEYTDKESGKNDSEPVGAGYDPEEEILKELFQKAKKKFGENVVSNAEKLVEDENKNLYAIMKDDLTKSIKVIIFDSLDDSIKSVSVSFTGAYFLNGQSYDNWAQATQTWGLVYGEARTLWSALHGVQRFNQIESEIRVNASMNNSDPSYALEKINQVKMAYGGLYVLKLIAPIANMAIAAQCGPFAPFVTAGLNLVENMLFETFEEHLEASLMHYKSGGKGSLFNWQVDPSGYIYSGIDQNRIQGATVTAYWIPFDEEDEHYWDAPDETKAVIWDSVEYSQLNPLTTDTDGNYAWDVPEGWWRVVAEKEGYVTYTTEWLPVPPPQTEVNINLKRIGDANGDNYIDILDATLAQKYAVGKAYLTEEQIAAADVNGDNNVDILDATDIQKFAVGKIKEFKKKA